MKTFKLFSLIIFFQIIFILNAYTEIIDYIAATVDKQIITFSELKEKLAPVIEYYRQTYSGNDLEKLLEKAQQDALDDAIEEKILLINAENLKVEATEEEIAKNIEEFKKKFSTPDEFYAELEKEDITLADLKEKTKSRIKITKFIRSNVLRDIRITEEEITNFYEGNKNSFITPGQVKISQILIKPSDNNDTDKKIYEILQKLQSGEDFSSLAKLYSEGPNASLGGDLGFVYLEELNPQIKESLANIEVGAYTRPVRTSAGYHIMKLEAKKLPQYTPLSEVKDLIRKKVYDLKVGEAYEQWMENARKNVEIVIFVR